MNIVLIGYRCSGKTSIGKILAMELGRDFLDTDDLIEFDAGCTIEFFILKNGWDRFRDLEKKIIKKVSKGDNLVIATGGGVVTDEDNIKNLRRNGFVVWLKGDIDVLKKRMEKDRLSGKVRPSLTGDDPKDEIKRVLDIRDPLYQLASDITVDTGPFSIRQVADQILKKLP